ncbi:MULTISPECIES: CDP-alcohol phosphatidyltransferase family protein [Pedobacter]|uniref:CDP-alcohol phosphatidyltransferase family protein n=1 Tax=Pedobacter TaxID=84567 RepID=UPI0011F69E1B|nr:MULTISPECIES: CDP-alcohol phosphatidyltransferase family protein [Pedobacter]RZL34471.1 MAG: CDP-alcohol phosphatidyltransferase family protein [Pedobacter sp.]
MSDLLTQREKIFADRKRTNVLKNGEQRFIHFLLKQLPKSITPNILTIIGLLGSIIVFAAFLLAINFNKNLLLLGIIGLFINWFGDSLDGRLAYYRQIPRKWYGFALDIIMDWASIVLIGLGYYFYVAEPAKILAFLFVVFYGWSMLISLLRYKIIDVYRIDSGIFGPTELRIIISFILLIEVVLPGSIIYSAILITITLFVVNILDTIQLLRFGNERDGKEKE